MKIQNSFFWLAVCAALTCAFYFTHQIIFIVLGAIWIFRVISLDSRMLLVMLFLVCGLTVLLCNRKNSSIELGKSLENKHVEKLMVKTEPDQIELDGDQFIIRGTKNSLNGKHINVYGSMNTVREKQFLKENHSLNVEFSGVITTPMAPTNFNQIDSRIFSYSQGVYLNLKKGKIDRARIDRTINIIDWVHCLRKKLIVRCGDLSEPVRGYVLGAVLGYQDDFMQLNSDKYKNTGIIHLFCISGLHVFFLIDGLKKSFQRFRFTRELSEDLILILIPVYFILGGGSTSLLRCATIGWINVLCSRLKFNQMRAIDTWGLVLLINLFLNPFVLFNLGGQLSYLLSFVLGVLNFKSRIYSAIVLFLIEIPSLLYFTYQLHILTVVFNLIFIPMFSMIILPCAIALLLIPWLSPILSIPINLFEELIKIADRLPGLILIGKPNINIVLLLLVITLGLVTVDQTKEAFKKVCGMMFLVYSCLYLTIRMVPFGEVSFFDVGQGDSILVREPFNRRVSLIDTGGKVGFSKTGWRKSKKIKVPQANRCSANYLKSLGISKIDNLCLTHQDADHIGDVGAICKSFKIKRLIIGAGMQNSRGFRKKVKPVIDCKTTISCVRSNDVLSNFPFRILYPEESGKGENKDSLALFGIFGQQRFLLTGDLDQSGEKRMMEKYPNLRVDIFKLGHHGSKTSNSDVIFDITTPHVTIVSAGRENRFGHPHEEVMNKIKKRHITNYSTQSSGMIRYQFCENHTGRWITKLKGN